MDSITDRIANSMEAKFTRIIDSLDSAVTSLESRDDELGETAMTISNAVLQLVEATNDSSRSIGDAADRVRNQVDRQVSAQTLALNAQTDSNPAPLSYAAATAKTHVPLVHAGAVAKQDERTRQIIIQPDADSLESFRALSELELIAKAALAFDAIEQGEDEAPSDLRFVGARKRAAGTIILDLNTTQSANWLKKTDIRPLFMQQFSARSTFKDHEYRVLAEFVPVTFSYDALAALERIEKDSGAAPGGLVRAEWAKLPEKRHALQRVAHLKLFFSSPEAANYAIRNGLYIAGKKVNVRKMQQEARRCAKCQRYGHGHNEGEPHFAKDCKWLHDTCGGCGQKHRKEECTADLAVDSFCVNCNAKGHTVWDRNCPTFINRCKSMNASKRDSGYTLFITRDSSTWEAPALDSSRQEEDDWGGWSQVSKRGSSGRGGNRDRHKPSNPIPVARGRTQTSNSGPPVTNANRTELGANPRLRQLTFEETAERHRSRSSSRDPLADPYEHPGVPIPQFGWGSAPHQTSDQYSSWFNETESAIHQRQPTTNRTAPSRARQFNDHPSTQC